MANDGLLHELSRVGRDVVRAGLVVGSGGNLSVRRPGAQALWVTAAGTWLDRLEESSYVEVRLDDGGPVRRGRAKLADGSGDGVGEHDPDGPETTSRPGVDRGIAPTSELPLHLATYRARPDVNAIVHLHPQMTILLDALGERIRLVTTDHAYYVGPIARTGFYPPGSTALAEAAAAAVADGTNCVILTHQGCSVLGETLDLAHRRAANLEEAARLTYQALLLTGGLPGREVPQSPSSGTV